MELNKTTDSSENFRKKPGYGLGIFVSVGFGQLMIEFFGSAYGSRIFDFYENEVKLDTLLITIAMVIYAIWNMVNDPIVGYLADKPRKFWKRWGKRTPWILGGGFPWALGFILLFAVPNFDPDGDKAILFIWLLVSICIYDTLFSIYDTTYNSLIPDKFRNNKDRLKQSGWAVILGLIGSVVGSILPSLLIDYNDRGSFLKMSIIIAAIGIVSLIIQIPGIKETPEMIERVMRVDAKKEQEPFIKVLKQAVKQRSFLAYLLIYLCYQSCSILMMGSVPYVNRFILEGDSDQESLIMLGYIITGALSIPMWSFFAKKIGNKKVFVIGGFLITLFAIPLMFVDTLVGVIIAVAFLGVGFIGFWVMMLPILGDVVDEASVIHKKRQEGLYMGIRTFFGRISIIIQSLTFYLIHTFTGFDQEAEVQETSAIIGIRLQVSLIPLLIMLVGVILFVNLYDITPQKKLEIQEKLAELDL